MSARPKLAPEPTTADFQPSPLPTTIELVSLAAHLLGPMDINAIERMARTGYHLATAVNAAARLWGAALTCDVEREVEQGRLSSALDRDSAAARWREWHLMRLGLKESAEKSAKEAAKLEEKAKVRFAKLKFPAKSDEVLLAIMGGNNIGRSASARHERFMSAWIAAFQPRSVERVREDFERRVPGPVEVLEEERRTGGNGRSRFEGDPQALSAAVEAARVEHQRREAEAVQAELDTLARYAQSLRDSDVDEALAKEWLRIWDTHSAAEARRKGGAANAKRIAEGKKTASKNSRRKKIAAVRK